MAVYLTLPLFCGLHTSSHSLLPPSSLSLIISALVLSAVLPASVLSVSLSTVSQFSSGGELARACWGGGGCRACFRSGPISVGGGGGWGNKRCAPVFPGRQGEPADGRHHRFVLANIWADQVCVCRGGGGSLGTSVPCCLPLARWGGPLPLDAGPRASRLITHIRGTGPGRAW